MIVPIGGLSGRIGRTRQHFENLCKIVNRLFAHLEIYVQNDLFDQFLLRDVDASVGVPPYVNAQEILHCAFVGDSKTSAAQIVHCLFNLGLVCIDQNRVTNVDKQCGSHAEVQAVIRLAADKVNQFKTGMQVLIPNSAGLLLSVDVLA